MQPSLHDLSITLSLSCSSPFCMPLSPVSKIFVMFLFLYFCPFLYPSLSSHHVLPLNCYIHIYPSSCSNLPPFSLHPSPSPQDVHKKKEVDMCGLSCTPVALPLSTVLNLTTHLTSTVSFDDSVLKKVCSTRHQPLPDCTTHADTDWYTSK